MDFIPTTFTNELNILSNRFILLFPFYYNRFSLGAKNLDFK